MAREPLSAVPMHERPGKSHTQRVSERTRRVLDTVRAHHNKSHEMDETADAVVRELGIRHDDDVEAVIESVGDVWQ
jgi:predicted transcriptional regulator